MNTISRVLCVAMLVLAFLDDRRGHYDRAAFYMALAVFLRIGGA